MWPRQHQYRDLRALLSRVEAAVEPASDIATDLLQHACPRLNAAPRFADSVRRLIEAKAWVDLGFWLVEWELPDWTIHRLECDDGYWCCSICVRGLAVNWVEDIAEFQHDNPALAVLGAFVLAQLRKLQGRAPSNVIPFRRAEARAGYLSEEAER
jgi:hypothetical protein